LCFGQSGVDEIQYAKGHKYLTLVYQIDLGMTYPVVSNIRAKCFSRLACRAAFFLGT